MYNTGIFPNSASGNGISKKNGLGDGTGTPSSGPSTSGTMDDYRNSLRQSDSVLTYSMLTDVLQL